MNVRPTSWRFQKLHHHKKTSSRRVDSPIVQCFPEAVINGVDYWKVFVGAMNAFFIGTYRWFTVCPAVAYFTVACISLVGRRTLFRLRFWSVVMRISAQLHNFEKLDCRLPDWFSRVMWFRPSVWSFSLGWFLTLRYCTAGGWFRDVIVGLCIIDWVLWCECITVFVRSNRCICFLRIRNVGIRDLNIFELNKLPYRVLAAA